MMQTLDELGSFRSDDGLYKMVQDVEDDIGTYRIFWNQTAEKYAVKKHGSPLGNWSKTDDLEYVESRFDIKR